MFVIDPATFDPDTAIRVAAPGGGSMVGWGGLRHYPEDVRQASGCFFQG